MSSGRAAALGIILPVARTSPAAKSGTPSHIRAGSLQRFEGDAADEVVVDHAVSGEELLRLFG